MIRKFKELVKLYANKFNVSEDIAIINVDLLITDGKYEELISFLNNEDVGDRNVSN